MEKVREYNSNFVSYYPKYEYLDQILFNSKKKVLNIYVDLKGCMPALYQEWAVKYILSNSTGVNSVDNSIFRSMLEYIQWHKVYAKKRNIQLKMFIFFESGISSYHSRIYSNYKSERRSSDFFGLDLETREFFHKILDKNYHVIDRVCGKLPDVSVIRLKFLEADFVPQYLLDRVLTKDDVESAAHVIYSLDKDMLQFLTFPDTYQFYRNYKKIKLLSKENVINHYVGKDFPAVGAEWFEMILALHGDASDGFEGIRGIGAITAARLLEKYIITLCGGSIETVYKRIQESDYIFTKRDDPNIDPFSRTVYESISTGKLTGQLKHIKNIIDNEDIIVRNMKLLSYRLLCDSVDGGYPADMTDKKNLMIDSVYNTPKVPSPQVLYNALNKADLLPYLSENLIANLF